MGSEPFRSRENWSARASGRMLVYFGPPLKESPTPQVMSQLARDFRTQAMLWSYDYDSAAGPWYSWVCDDPEYSVDRITRKNVRYYVRRSLKACAVRRVDLNWIAENAYDTFMKASSRYKQAHGSSRESFEKNMRALGGNPTYSAYAVTVGEQLAAYAIVVRLGEVLNVAVAKFDPEFSSSFPMYGLYYTIAHEALADGQFRYVDNGLQPLLHDTNIGEFLARMEWRKAYCRLGLYLRPMCLGALLAARCMEPVWRRWLPEETGDQIRALLKAREIASQSVTGRWPQEAAVAEGCCETD